MLIATRFVVSDEFVTGPNGDKLEVVTVGSDGDTYHFSLTDGFDRLAGKTWSPDEITKPGKLVDIAFTMRDLCKTKDKRLLAKLGAQVEELATVLKQAPSDVSR